MNKYVSSRQVRSVTDGVTESGLDVIYQKRTAGDGSIVTDGGLD